MEESRISKGTHNAFVLTKQTGWPDGLGIPVIVSYKGDILFHSMSMATRPNISNDERYSFSMVNCHEKVW